MRRQIFIPFFLICLICLPLTAFFVGCGGGGGSGSSDSGDLGTFSLNVTDAKPVLPENTESVLVTFEEVHVHKAGEGWTTLPLAQEPYTIDLLKFQQGKTTELVPPVSLEPGKYTQIRIVVSSAQLITDTKAHSLDVPSGNLKTDTQFDFQVEGGGAVDITLDFDLSRSIVVTGQQPPTYKLKPVLHINQTQEAATIRGQITENAFVTHDCDEATVTVFWDKDLDGNVDIDHSEDEVYTQVVVAGNGPATFSIFWLVPEQGYIVQFEMDGNNEDPEFEETLSPGDLPAGAVYDLDPY
ncbi:MAG: DUF4382 domain-containing protein [Deltaproteobacteria bacterium]|nr:DUF4382 domain-containing protein [Deltaproteobacteria bacterium]